MGTGAPARRGEVLVRYTGTSPTRVIGPVSGRAYLFVPGSAPQPVTAQDAPALLGTRFFTHHA